MAGIGNLFEQLDPAKVNQAKTPAMPVISQQEEPDFFDRLFPKRDPMTGEQGGLLANPLFRIGMSLLARSGPQKNPTDLGQIIAGSVADFGQSRIDEDQASAQFIKNQDIRKSWKELNEKDAWAADLDPEEMLKRTMNPAGDPSALTAQAPNTQGVPATSYYQRLGGLESNNNPDAKNKLSTASGRFQFIDSTRAWVDKQLNLNPNDRSEATEQKRIEYFTDVNSKNLKMNGLADTDANKYFTHLLGSKGGVDFIKMAMQAPDHRAETVLPAKVVAANKNIFEGRTLGEVYGIIERSIAQGKWDFSGVREGAPKQNLGSFSSQPQAPAQFPPSPTFKPQEFGGAVNSASPPQPPAGAPQAPNPAQGAVSAAPQTTALPAGGPAQGSPTATPVPPLEKGPNGLPTKASILRALEALPLPEKNQLVLGAWLEANGNKREFAENLGKALLARGTARTGLGASNRDSKYQRAEMLLPDGRVEFGSYDPDNGQIYLPDGKGGLELAPPGTRPATPSMGGPLNQNQFNEISRTLDIEEIAMKKFDNYVKTIGNTNVGLERWADEIVQHFKTLFNSGQLTQEQINRAIATGDIQSLVGLSRIDVVGPGVMTAQDAQFVLETLGGDVTIWQNPNVVKERLKVMLELKKQRLKTDLQAYNRNAKIWGLPERKLDIPDTSKWDTLPAMQPTKPEEPVPTERKFKVRVKGAQ